MLELPMTSITVSTELSCSDIHLTELLKIKRKWSEVRVNGGTLAKVAC